MVPLISAFANSIDKWDRNLVEEMEKLQVKLVVIRHGEGIHNTKGIMTSSKSPGIYLTKTGIDQVYHAAQQLKEKGIEYIYVSPLYRTLQTAQILGEVLNIPYGKMVVDERLREQSYGDYEGYTWVEYEKLFPPLDTLEAAAINGESGLQVYERTQNFLYEIVRTHPGKTILIVTHGYTCVNIQLCLRGTLDNQPTTAGYLVF
jgi:broad specificity phosphatase PhoE